MSSQDDQGSDRRRWRRLEVHGEIVGQIYTETAAPILDLSEGGALLEVPCVLRPRSLYNLRLNLGQGTQLLLKSTVVRSYVHHFEPVGEGESRIRYHAALQFVDLSHADRNALRRRVAGELPGMASASLDLHTPSEPDPLLAHGGPPAEPLLDRRDSERVTFEGSFEGEVGLHLEARVVMLSEGGMRVRMPFSPLAGSFVASVLDVDGERVQVRAVVRNSFEEAQDDETVYEVGLEFVEISDHARARIADYMSRRKTDTSEE